VSTRNDIHLSAERIQAFLEGDLPIGGRERREVEEHLTGCSRCSAEVDAWRVLFADLAELAAQPLPNPSPGFAERVMSDVRRAQPGSQEERSWLASLFSSKGRHLSGKVLQDLADGLLSPRRLARAQAHLVACSRCTGEVEAWRRLMATLARIPRFAPPELFADRVMAALGERAVTARAVARRAPATVAPWEHALALARRAAARVIPRTRRAWAALSGVAVTPAAIFGLVLWVVFSHPTLTPQALASFAMWQVSDLLAGSWNSLLANGLDLASTGAYESALRALAAVARSSRLPLLAGAAFVYAAAAAVALRVLYKTLIAHRRYARVSSR
jgi:anti-sigma factor RsiW